MNTNANKGKQHQTPHHATINQQQSRFNQHQQYTPAYAPQYMAPSAQPSHGSDVPYQGAPNTTAGFPQQTRSPQPGPHQSIRGMQSSVPNTLPQQQKEVKMPTIQMSNHAGYGHSLLQNVAQQPQPAASVNNSGFPRGNVMQPTTAANRNIPYSSVQFVTMQPSYNHLANPSAYHYQNTIPQYPYTPYYCAPVANNPAYISQSRPANQPQSVATKTNTNQITNMQWLPPPQAVQMQAAINQPPPPTPLAREKKALKIIDPNTRKEVIPMAPSSSSQTSTSPPSLLLIPKPSGATTELDATKPSSAIIITSPAQQQPPPPTITPTTTTLLPGVDEAATIASNEDIPLITHNFNNLNIKEFTPKTSQISVNAITTATTTTAAATAVAATPLVDEKITTLHSSTDETDKSVLVSNLVNNNSDTDISPINVINCQPDETAKLIESEYVYVTANDAEAFNEPINVVDNDDNTNQLNNNIILPTEHSIPEVSAKSLVEPPINLEITPTSSRKDVAAVITASNNNEEIIKQVVEPLPITVDEAKTTTVVPATVAEPIVDVAPAVIQPTSTTTMEIETSSVPAVAVPTTDGTNAVAPAKIYKPSIDYQEGQWSPANLSGRKFYTLEQLIALRECPASQLEPNCKGLGEIATVNNFLPKFMTQKFNKQQPITQRGSAYRQRSIRNDSQQNNRQQQITNSGSINKGMDTGMIHVSLSLREEVKLNETENAWKPTFLQKRDQNSTNENKEEVLYRNVRGVLNKLTPEKFETLLSEMKSFNIDTMEELNGVIILVFEKAIDEPNFSSAYAKLCYSLSTKCIESTNSDKDKGDKVVQFKKSLITKCQEEFENHVNVEISEKLVPFQKRVDETTDIDVRAERVANLEEEERKLRRRSVGTVRFIGELFKIDMLTSSIMIWCISTLVQKHSEDKLECLCKLLTTIGKKVETKTTDPKNYRDLSEYFKQMVFIVNKKGNVKVSSRVRFMLQDVIELRKSNWVPRRNEVNPKTMSQIQKESEAEINKIQLLNYSFSDRRDDNRSGGHNRDNNRMGGGGGGGGGGGSGGRGGNNDFNQKSNRGTTPLAVDASKFRQKATINDTTPFGSSSQFKWSQNPSSSTTAPAPIVPTKNMYAVLDNARSSNIISGNNNNRGGKQQSSQQQQQQSSYHSKGSMERFDDRRTHSRGSMESERFDRNYSKGSMEREQYDDHRGSRSQYKPVSRENSAVRNYSASRTVASQSMHAMGALDPSNKAATMQRAKSTQKIERSEPNDENRAKIKKIVRDLLEGHNVGEVTLENCQSEIDIIDEKYRWAAVHELYNTAIEHPRLKSADYVFAGILCSQWIKLNIITADDYLHALKQFLEPIEDISIDIPKIWLHIAQFITPTLKAKYITLKDLKEAAATLIAQSLGQKFLQELLPYLLTEHGPQFIRDLFIDSKLQWSDFLSANCNQQEFIAKNKFEFVFDNSVAYQPAAGAVTKNLGQLQNRIKQFLIEDTKTDVIVEYINANVTTIDKPFIRALTSAVVEHAIHPNQKLIKVNEKSFEQGIKLLNKYIDSNDELELECLFAIQLLIMKLEHPVGVLQCLLTQLDAEDIISFESFMKWRDTPDEPEGKGVVLKYLNSFFRSLEEAQGESSSSDEDSK